ncbi:MAG: SpoIIE family protein phosphatase, partial [Gammaproteobacteria bacterium]|nr:SpoIIE family protein phosphatase [Gammaproteobacteria bacterium]
MDKPFRNTADKKRLPVVLIVDDDAVVTQSLRTLLELETDYRILTFQSPLAALAEIRDISVDVVISDFLMPHMNGLEFLSEVKKLHPDVPRIMLTGYADKENSIRAINEVGIFQYIEKPWDNDQLKLVLSNALTKKCLQAQLTERIRELDVTLRDRNRLVERDELLREELSLAQSLQRGMLPDAFPERSGICFFAQYLPALEIGGDFYDVVPLANNRLGVLVADATGHGIQAALSTAIVKFAFSTFRQCDVGVEDILIGMNKILLRGLPADTFVAASIIVIDTDRAECRLMNAGLPYPFLLRRKTRTAERIMATGLMLGIIDEQLYKPAVEHKILLEKGDVLIVYTDGIGEVENEDRETFEQSMLGTQLVAHADKCG